MDACTPSICIVWKPSIYVKDLTVYKLLPDNTCRHYSPHEEASELECHLQIQGREEASGLGGHLQVQGHHVFNAISLSYSIAPIKLGHSKLGSIYLE